MTLKSMKTERVIDQNNILNVFDPFLRNCLAYLTSNAIFEFLGQFAFKCIYHFCTKKSVDNFEIKYKTYNCLVWGAVPPKEILNIENPKQDYRET